MVVRLDSASEDITLKQTSKQSNGRIKLTRTVISELKT